MGILDRLFKRGAAPVAETPAETPECRHLTLTPRWDNADDMGKMDLVTRYHCEGCGSEFTPREAEQLSAASQ